MRFRNWFEADCARYVDRDRSDGRAVVFAAGQNVPQNTTGRNPGTQVPPGETSAAPTTAASQTTPEKKMEVGVGGVSDGSFKFGEYNGLQNSGVFGVGNFDFRGGAAYDSGSTWRWRFQGTNLGLENRNLSVEFGKQGKFQLRFAYDELLANRSDTYQTPYLGAGTNNLTLPSNWIKPMVPQVNATNVNFRSFDPIAGTGSVINKSGVLTPPTTAQLAMLANIRRGRCSGFPQRRSRHQAHPGRRRVQLQPRSTVGYSDQLQHEHKAGRKALGAVSSQVSENAIIMPDQVDWTTTQASVAVNYKRKKLFLTFAYYGSFFNNNVKSMTWQDVADPTKSATMASAPSNQFNQFSATAAYKISKTAKLVVTGSYGRNTQNEAFLGPSTAANGQLAFGLPAASLNGLVYDSMFSTKLTEKLGEVGSYRVLQVRQSRQSNSRQHLSVPGCERDQEACPLSSPASMDCPQRWEAIRTFMRIAPIAS